MFFLLLGTSVTELNLAKHGIIVHKPARPEFVSKEIRLRSVYRVPGFSKELLTDLANAGEYCNSCYLDHSLFSYVV